MSVSSVTPGSILCGEEADTIRIFRVARMLLLCIERQVIVTHPVFLAVTRPVSETFARLELLVRHSKYPQASAGSCCAFS